jgi:hypothetical protein
MDKKYHDTPAGRKAAIDSTPIMDFWEEKVDYRGVHIEGDDQLTVVQAVAETARDFPELFDEDQRVAISSLVKQIKEQL